MVISYDPAKRARTLEERGLDFNDAGEVFAGDVLTRLDDREYLEPRWQTIGLLKGREVFIVWTERDGSRRVISMRKANADEQRYYREFVDRPG